MNTDNSARANAAASTAFGNINRKIDANTKRMAGSALIAGLLPSFAMYGDDQETNLAGFLASGAITSAGLGLGGYYGYKNSHINDADKYEFIRNEISKLKNDSKALARDIGPQAAVEQFARDKQLMLDDIDPIDSKRAVFINKQLESMPDVGPLLAKMDIGNKSPRDIRGMTRGALIGGLASVIPAYLAVRNGDIEQ